MRRYEVVKEDVRRLVELRCSVCDKDVTHDPLEFQETIQISHMGGFGSVFGDGLEVNVDLCQHCFKKLLGKYCTVL